MQGAGEWTMVGLASLLADEPDAKPLSLKKRPATLDSEAESHEKRKRMKAASQAKHRVVEAKREAKHIQVAHYWFASYKHLEEPVAIVKAALMSAACDSGNCWHHPHFIQLKLEQFGIVSKSQYQELRRLCDKIMLEFEFEQRAKMCHAIDHLLDYSQKKIIQAIGKFAALKMYSLLFFFKKNLFWDLIPDK